MKYGFLPVYKKIGETPLSAIERVRFSRPELANLPMTYAGRLDPMAEGIVIALAGEDCKEKDKYLEFSKEYEVEILFGFSTDTYDLLGKVVGSKESKILMLPDLEFNHDASLLEFSERIKGVLSTFTGKIDQPYPPYSSKPVDGKPLFQIAREGRIDEVQMPSHIVHIKQIDLMDTRFISKEELRKKIKNIIAVTSGDFRQDEIYNLWQEVLDNTVVDSFFMVKLRISSGAGAYMRVIAHNIGEAVGVPAVAFSIKRTKIGNFNLSDNIYR
jgi:tRNA pseudouridine55 synthase